MPSINIREHRIAAREVKKSQGRQQLETPVPGAFSPSNAQPTLFVVSDKHPQLHDPL